MPDLSPGSNRCQCTVCGEHFNSAGAFDKHRISLHGGARGCKTVKGMVGAGFIKNEAGFWITGKNIRTF